MGSLVSLVFIAVIAQAGAVVQLTRSREPRTLGHASEVFLVWVLVVCGYRRRISLPEPHAASRPDRKGDRMADG
jgi:hypothetical protein